jgi:hypothetical protein
MNRSINYELNNPVKNCFNSPPLTALKALSKVAKDKFLDCKAFTAVTPDAINKVATMI